MAELWFVLLAALLAAYVVLDGFDLGAGALHRIVAHTDEERRAVIAAVGPFWDGNEVFLLAAGGTIFLAFSRVLAAALSGLYLAVFLVLWATLLRGVSIEFRSHLRDRLWRSFWDVVFQLSSASLALLLGVALGNVLRGFPLEPDGYFALELFSLGSPRLSLGVIDGYTLSTGVLGALVLSLHGARFLSTRTDGAVRDRSSALANRLAAPTLAMWGLVTALSWWYAHDAVEAFLSRPAAWLLVVAALVSFAVCWERGRRGAARAAFLGSALFVASLVALAAASAYPVLLRSTRAGVRSMTIDDAANAPSSLSAGLSWWFIAAVLVAVYFVILLRLHGGKADAYGAGGDSGVDWTEPK